MVVVCILNLVMLTGEIEPRWTTDIGVLCCFLDGRRVMERSIFYSRVFVLPTAVVCTVHILYPSNIVMSTLNMGSSYKTDSKYS